MSRKLFMGTVRQFNNNEGEGGGYGFIGRPDGKDLFVHRSAMVGAGERTLFAGDKVSFKIETGKDGRPRARNVRVKLRAEETTYRRRHD